MGKEFKPRTIIIGAGMSGILMGYRLMQAGYAASLANGGGIGLDHVAGAVMFVHTIPLRGLTPADFTEEIRRLVERIETWQRVVHELRHARTNGKGQAAPDYANGAAVIRG